MEKKYFGSKFYNSRLNTFLLLALIILMVFAIRIMLQNKEIYLPFLQEKGKVINQENNNDKNILTPIVIRSNDSEISNVKTKEVILKPKTFNFTAIDNNKSITISKGDIISITLSNPGDGGYQFNDPVFNSSVIKIDNHTHNNPKVSNPPLMGDFGTDNWNFLSISSGTSDIKINASRLWESVAPTNIFSIKVIVK